MKRKYFSLLLTGFMLLLGSAYVFADVEKTYASYAIFPTFIEAKIIHTAVNSVSSIDSILNIKTQVNFGNYISATAQMLYYFDEDPSSVVTVNKGPISHKANFYMATPKIQGSYDKINYQIKITLKKNGDDTEYYSYWPSTGTYYTPQIVSSTTTHPAIITNSTTTHITVADGGSLEYESGNQEFTNTKLIIPAGALSGDTDVTVTQSQVETSTDGQEMVALYNIEAGTPGTEVESGSSMIANFYYGIETNAKKFDLMYRETPTSEWEKVTVTGFDAANKIISANITKFGEYAVFISKNLSSNDYRPEKRVRIKSRIASGAYEGFRFKYLKEGDVVKIYNLNGKKIREITAGDGNGFVWNGRKDNGDWAESGTYVYQIKVRGKIVSGTIAFVW
jgi:hypothetical protein